MFCTFTDKTFTYNTHKTYSQTYLSFNYSKIMFSILGIWNLWIKIWNITDIFHVTFCFQAKNGVKTPFLQYRKTCNICTALEQFYFACMIMKVNNLSKKLLLLIEIVIDKIIPYMLFTIYYNKVYHVSIKCCILISNCNSTRYTINISWNEKIRI